MRSHLRPGAPAISLHVPKLLVPIYPCLGEIMLQLAGEVPGEVPRSGRSPKEAAAVVLQLRAASWLLFVMIGSAFACGHSACVVRCMDEQHCHEHRRLYCGVKAVSWLHGLIQLLLLSFLGSGT